MPRARPVGHGLGGRPRRPRKPGELVSLTLRVTAGDRDAIQAAAGRAGLSISGWVVAMATQPTVTITIDRKRTPPPA